MSILNPPSISLLRLCRAPLVVLASLACVAVPIGGPIAATPGNASGNRLLHLDFENASVVPLPSGSEKFDVLRLNGAASRAAEAPIQYEAGTAADRFSRVVPDPVRADNHVLQYWMRHARVPGARRGYFKGRVQLNLANIERTEVYERHRMYLHPDLGLYRTYPKANRWFTLSTLWIGRNDRPHPFKISLNLVKEAGVGKPLYFMATGDKRVGGRPKHGKWENVWGNVNTAFQVPVGDWLDVETGYRQGDGRSGRYFVRVRRQSDSAATTIFDITGWTYNPESPQPIPLTNWNPLKLYTSAEIIDHIRAKGGVAQIFWDDLDIATRWP